MRISQEVSITIAIITINRLVTIIIIIIIIIIINNNNNKNNNNINRNLI